MNEIKQYQCVVTIAGSDSSGGAGIQADIKTISATGCYAASVITTLTAQNTLGVQAITEVAPEFIGQQIDSIFNDFTVNAIKIGMLYNERIIDVVASKLAEFKTTYVVLDPVMIAKSGHELLKQSTVSYLKKRLFPLTYLITPNLPEAEKLIGRNIKNREEMELAAKQLSEQFKLNVLLKGGHLNMPTSSDVLFSYQNQQYHWFHAKRILTKNTHGTGCTLSSAIASYLAQGKILTTAITAAKEYLTHAIQSGSMIKLGNGCGPVDHFYYQT